MPANTARVSPATTRPRGGGKQITDSGCPERLEPGRSNLGDAQENWLYDQFRAAPAKWNIVTQDS
jgi:alkaline phosphatase D